MLAKIGALSFVLLAFGIAAPASAGPDSTFRPGAKVFLRSMPDGFDGFLKSAFDEKKVPVVVVATKEEADFEISGASETQKASTSKKIFMGSWHSDEQASIAVANLKSGEIVFAYSANKKNSARGKRTSAEACAKHLKEHLEKAK